MDALLAILLTFAIPVLYFAPGLVAKYRNHPQVTAIAVLNLLLGWTFLGCVIAMVWACVDQKK